MENSNSREYLEKITSSVIDNLRQTGPAPSVQLQDVPRKPFGGMTDEEEAELDDLDEDENKDVRMTEHRWDKHVEHDNEFEASDDDEMAQAHGATRQNGNKRTFTDYRKEEMEIDNADAPPAKVTNGASTDEPAEEQAGEDAHDVNDDTIDDISAPGPAEKEVPSKESEKPDETAKEPEASKVDGDGDIGMEDSAAPEETAIKKEEVEPEAPAEPSAPTEKATKDEPTAPEATDSATKEPTSEPKTTEETSDKPAEAPEKAQSEQPDDAMDVDTEKDKPEPPTEKSKSPVS
jgi:histone deacetylase 1/2